MKRTRGKNSTLRRLLHLGCAVLSLIGPPLVLSAQPKSKYDVEASYLSDFGKFVRWPTDSSPGSFDICVIGKDPFGQTLNRLTANEQIGGKAIHKRDITAPEESKGCAIVYVGESESAKLEKILAALDGKGELLVSDLPHFIENGGAIQFVIEKHRVRFAVNLDAASRNRLVLSSELLKVAVDVTGKPQSGVDQ